MNRELLKKKFFFEIFFFLLKLFIINLLITEINQEKPVRTSGVTKPPRKFAGVIIAFCGLPARGKSQIAHSLTRRLNWNGETAKGM